MSTPPVPQRTKPWRPIILIALVILTLGFSALSWARFGLAVGDGSFFNQETRLPLSAYFIASGAVWGIASLAAAIGDWYRKAWALILTGVGAVLLSIWFWVEKLFLIRTSLATTNWLFNVILNVILLVFVITTVLAVYPYQPPQSQKGKRDAQG
jgi:hypothetical protein